MKEKYTKELLEEAVKNSTSIAGVLRFFGLKMAGGNYTHISRKIISFGLDTSHFTGRAHNKGKEALNKSVPKDYLRAWSKDKSVNTDKIKKRLFRDGLKKRACERCGKIKWEGEDIPLAVHHKDGNRWNNLLNNLEVLCYNCHGLTRNYSGKSNMAA